MRRRLWLLLLLVAAAGSRADTKSVTVRLSNPLSIARPNEPVVIPVADLRAVAPDFNAGSFVLTLIQTSSGEVTARAVAAQADDTNGDGAPDEIAFQADFPPRSGLTARIEFGTEADIAPKRVAFPKRAHAAFQQKYEGMGWESDRVAWRMYFDERNAFDMYGKRKHGLALDYFAKPEVDYHSESPIGRDVFKIGDALGIGAVGAYVDGSAVKVGNVERREWRVVADGPVRAIADLIYTGWDVAGRKVDLTSRITVWAGQHWFEHAITARNAAGLMLVTGLPRKPGVERLGGRPGDPYIATWGHQALVPGATATEADPVQNLGLGIIAPSAGQTASLSDPANHLVRVGRTVVNGVVSSKWRVVSAWDQEAPDADAVDGLAPEMALPEAVQSADGWKAYVANQAVLATAPVLVRVQTARDRGLRP